MGDDHLAGERVLPRVRSGVFFLALLGLCWFGGVRGATAQDAPACPPTTGTDFAAQSPQPNFTDVSFADYPPGALVGANFAGLQMAGARFDGQDLTGASFEGAIMGPSQQGVTSFGNARLTGTCFIGATINAADFTDAALDCTDFSQTGLLQATFGPYQLFNTAAACRTKFVGSTLDVHAIQTQYWKYTDFSHADFQNLTPAQFSLAGKDISNAILAGTDFQGIDMTKAGLSGVDFTGADLTGAILANAALNGATLTGATATAADFICAGFYYTAGSASDPNAAACPNRAASSLPETPATLQKTVLTEAVLRNATMDYALLNQANLSGADFTGASLRHASLESTDTLNAAIVSGTVLADVRLENAQINSVVFSNVNLSGITFTGTDSTLAQTSFNGSILVGADFTDATLESADFTGAILQNANFTRTTLKSVPSGNAGGAGGSGVQFTCGQLGGANFTSARVSQTSFANAVLPAAEYCCAPEGGATLCGTIASTGNSYGPVTFPPLSPGANVTCPDGQPPDATGNCPDDWRLSADWTTSFCSGASAQPVVMWTPPNCSAAPGDTVVFADPALEACILASLPGSEPGITLQTAAAMTEVNCPRAGISELGGLENFTGLTSLDLADNDIAEFGLSFPALVSLKLDGNDLTELTLPGMSALVKLSASDNALQSVSQDSQATALQFVDLSDNRLTSYDLPSHSALVQADLSNNLLTSVLDQYNSTLDRLTGLSYLDLSGNTLTTIGSLAALAYSAKDNRTGALRTLLLECNPSFQCASLELDGDYKPYQTSGCADFNAAANNGQGAWVANAVPDCN